MGGKFGSGINIPDHFSKSIEKVFGLKYLNSLMWIRIWDPESFDPGFGIRDGKIRVRDSGSKIRDQG
jgi:hypothetical protein